MSKVIVVSNCCGGSAKTTTVFNLGTEIVKKEMGTYEA